MGTSQSKQNIFPHPFSNSSQAAVSSSTSGKGEGRANAKETFTRRTASPLLKLPLLPQLSNSMYFLLGKCSFQFHFLLLCVAFMLIYKSYTNPKLNFGLAAQEQYGGLPRPGLCQDLPDAMGMAQTAIGSVLENNSLKLLLWPTSYFALRLSEQTGSPLCAIHVEETIQPVVMEWGKGRERGCWIVQNGEGEMLEMYNHNLYVLYYFTRS